MSANAVPPDEKGRDRMIAPGIAALGIGALAALGLAGAPVVAFAGEAWRLLFGWLAWPLAVLLCAFGAALLANRDADPWSLPWHRVLGAELFLAASAALLASAVDRVVPGSAARASSAGGLVGWWLATMAMALLGVVGAAVVWFGIGALGALVAGGVGERRVRERLRPSGEDGTGDSPLASVPADSSGSRRPKPMRAPGDGGQVPMGDASTDGEPTPTAAAETVAREEVAQVDAPPPRRASRSRRLPPEDIWSDDARETLSHADVESIADTVARTLESFGVPIDVVDVEQGPTLLRLGVRPGLVERGGKKRRVRVARLVALRDDLALALAAPTVRIEAPVPGRPVVGIEIPIPSRKVVGLRRLIADPAFRKAGRSDRLLLPLGRRVSGEPLIADLAAMPHLLIAGSTGSGKSVCMNAILCGLLSQSTPDRLRLLLVDPKRVELMRFAKVPHLLGPIVVDGPEAVAAMRWLLAEVDARYKRFAERRVRDLRGFNRAVGAGAELPTVVVAVDELADLMLTNLDDFEVLLTRIAQLGRATGVHLVVATQRPSVDVVTGLIKANFPGRIAFAVASQTDSRVVLDRPGAEALTGSGDMLFVSPESAQPRRAQGTYVSDAEMRRLSDFWSESHWPPPPRLAPWASLVRDDDPEEALVARAVELAHTHDRVTASLLQRRLRIGYRKARELYEILEAEGHLARRGAPGDVWPGREPEPPDETW